MTRTLQYNLTPSLVHCGLSSSTSQEDIKEEARSKDDTDGLFSRKKERKGDKPAGVENAEDQVNDLLQGSQNKGDAVKEKKEKKKEVPKKKVNYTAVRPPPAEKFMWNSFLLEKLKDVYFDWRIPIIHGFLSQSSILL